jgi:hypothetical protein
MGTTTGVKSATACLVAALGLLLAPAAPAATAPAGSCRLDLDGRLIEQLTLECEDGRLQEISKPGSSVALPPGRYRVRKVALKGDWSSSGRASAPDDWFTLSAQQPHRLAVGAPLRHTVRVSGGAMHLTLDYELVDAGGRRYLNRKRSAPPRFAVSKDGLELGSGSFKYG